MRNLIIIEYETLDLLCSRHYCFLIHNEPMSFNHMCQIVFLYLLVLIEQYMKTLYNLSLN